MDVKLNLPTEECTCGAKVFYDKYKKQVDTFIQHELQITSTDTTAIVVGKKLSERHIYLPEIKGVRSPHYKYDETGEISTTTTTTSTKSYLPKIHGTKKKPKDLHKSSSTSESLDTKKSKASVKSKKEKRKSDDKIRIDKDKQLARKQRKHSKTYLLQEQDSSEEDESKQYSKYSSSMEEPIKLKKKQKLDVKARKQKQLASKADKTVGKLLQTSSSTEPVESFTSSGSILVGDKTLQDQEHEKKRKKKRQEKILKHEKYVPIADIGLISEKPGKVSKSEEALSVSETSSSSKDALIPSKKKEIEKHIKADKTLAVSKSSAITTGVSIPRERKKIGKHIKSDKSLAVSKSSTISTDVSIPREKKTMGKFAKSDKNLSHSESLSSSEDMSIPSKEAKIGKHTKLDKGLAVPKTSEILTGVTIPIKKKREGESSKSDRDLADSEKSPSSEGILIPRKKKTVGESSKSDRNLADSEKSASSEDILIQSKKKKMGKPIKPDKGLVVSKSSEILTGVSIPRKKKKAAKLLKPEKKLSMSKISVTASISETASISGAASISETALISEEQKKRKIPLKGKKHLQELKSESISSDYIESEIAAESLQFKKPVKSEEFIKFLLAKSVEEGLHKNIIPYILVKSEEAGQKNVLLASLKKANEQSKLDTVFQSLMKAITSSELDKITANLIDERTKNRRLSLVTNLIDIHINDKNNIASMTALITAAQEEDPQDELNLILTEAIPNKKLSSLLSTLLIARDQGVLSNEINNLVLEVQAKNQNQLLSIFETLGVDSNWISDILAKAQEAGQLDQLIKKLVLAKKAGNLKEVILKLDEEIDAFPLDELPISTQREHLESLSPESLSSESLSDAGKLQMESRTKSQLPLISADYKSTYVRKIRRKSSNDSFVEDDHGERIPRTTKSKLKRRKHSSSLNSAESEISQVSPDTADDVFVVKSQKSKQLRRPRTKVLFKKLPKKPKDVKLRKSSVIKKRASSRLSIIKASQYLRRSVIDRLKQRLLYKRQYSIRYSLPDVDYSLIHRQTIAYTHSPTQSVEDEESGEENIIERKFSKTYSEAFLRKIYGNRPIGPTPIGTPQSTTSGSSSMRIRKKYPIKPKPKIKTEKIPKSSGKIKKNVIQFVKRKTSSTSETESLETSTITSMEILLDQKLTKVCEISGEERSERGYLVGFRYKDDDEAVDWRKKDKRARFGSQSNIADFDDEQDWVVRARRRAVVYFTSRKIQELFHFLGTHLISDTPDDPIQYLVILLENCLLYRNGVGQPPLIFEQYHVESLYCSMDKLNTGYITLRQYRIGMETLFVMDFQKKPKTNRRNMVSRETFINEALKRQRIQLKSLFRPTSIFKSKTRTGSYLGSVWSNFDLY